MKSTIRLYSLKNDQENNTEPGGNGRVLRAASQGKAELPCVRCDFLGLPRTLRLHELLGCCGKHMDTSNAWDCKKSPQQAEEIRVQRNPAERLPIGSGLKCGLIPSSAGYCDLCGFYGNPRTLRLHQLLGCCRVIPDCKKPKPLDQKMDSLTHTGENYFTCVDCNFKCVDSYDLIRLHKLTHTRVMPFSCKLCKYQSSSLSHLKKHNCTYTLKSLSPERLPVKQSDDKLTQSSSSKKRNVSQKTKEERPFSCKKCDFKCKTIGNLNHHSVVHSDEKPFSCNLCNFKCKLTYSLKSHTLTHTDDKPFSCNVCSFKCKTARNLRNHSFLHTGEKPFSCNLCSYKCINSYMLKKHNYSHTGKMPFSCELCSFQCKSATELRAHNLKHTGVKAFTCDICSRKYRSKATLQVHLLIHARKN